MMRSVIPIIILFSAFAFQSCTRAKQSKPDWCSQVPRVVNENLKRTDFSNYWFEVYQLEDNIYAIYEPYQWQEVISYLIIGNEFALLLDTGNGIGNIKQVVNQITSLPIRVLNTHSHYDHVGGNSDFDFIYGMDTEFTEMRMEGLPHERVAEEVSPEALCKPLPVGVDSAKHHIPAYEIDEYVEEGYQINLGNRLLEVISIPGHTPDAIGLWDKKNGLLWTGDTFYQGAIWLFAKETNMSDYKNSIKRLADISKSLKHLLPAHNSPWVDPGLLVELDDALTKIENEIIKGLDSTDGRVHYTFENFTILMKKN
ncbi:MAG TPA: MBL fold metallo-hydrolase [Cyclobacteriaceae bacterium]